MKVVIGISGKLGSGKNYITTNVIIPILEKYNKKYLELAFADQIKINVMTKNNIVYDDVYKNKTSFSRELLQKEGTDIGRVNDRNIWVKYMSNWINVFYNRGISNFVINDVRFINEYEYIKNNGGIMIKIIAPNRNNKRLLEESNGDTLILNRISNHCSECDLDILDHTKYDLIIYNDSDNINDTLDVLKNKFEMLLNTLVL
jgi:hypothetical protein